MSKPLGLAIVGVGWAGSRHAETIGELATVDKRVEITAFVDNDADHLQQTAAKFEVHATYSTLAAALDDPNVDAIDIATPHFLHEPMTIQTVEVGKHVIVEKPMAMNVDEATRMIHAAESNGVRLYVAANQSYEPYIEFLRQVVETGTPIGSITAASVAAGFRPRDMAIPVDVSGSQNQRWAEQDRGCCMGFTPLRVHVVYLVV
jgi:UDP-N-acetyl-2-amino-2-deoxyglucuronate dehydrogenase